MENSTGEITLLLRQWKDGDEEAYHQLLPLIYDELRKVAASYLRREREDHTLQTTALVHEVYLRLSASEGLGSNDRSHFFAVAARAMRRVLVDHARKQYADKRVGAHLRMPLEEAGGIASVNTPSQLLAIHDALEELSDAHPRPAKLVELRFFGGLSEDEAAEVLGVSRSSLTRDWRFARLWLHRRLQSREGE